MPTTATRSFPYSDGPGSDSGEAEWREMAKHFVADGLITSIGTAMAVTATTGMVLQAGIGAGFVQGNYFAFDTTTNLTIAAAHATLARIDRVVLRNDLTNDRVELDVVAGTPHASPTAPALTQTTAIWEISVATVAVAAATTTLVSGNITDARTLLEPSNGITALATVAPPVLSSSTSTLGVGTTLARADHNHGIGTPSAPPVLNGATSAAGSSGTPARSDHNHGIGTPSAPPVLSSSTSAAGTSTVPALSDHNHGIGTPSAPPVLNGATSAAGSSGTPARSDHNHGIGTPSAPPVLVNTTATSSAGSSGVPALSDHSHGIAADAAWTTYTPTWSSSGTQPALGNGTIVAAYRQRGKTLDVRIYITFGSTTTYGTGTYAFSLPGGMSAATSQAGTGFASYGTQVALTPTVSGSSVFPWAPTASGNSNLSQVTATVPLTWSTGGYLIMHLASIEIA